MLVEKLASSSWILSFRKAIEGKNSRSNFLMTPRLTISTPCTQAGLSKYKHWPSPQMPSSVSTPTCLRHLSKSSHHPTCSGIATQLTCHPSRFCPQSLNLTHPESASGKPSPKCACTRAHEIDCPHPTTLPKGTVWTRWCGRWWTEWEVRSWSSSKTLGLDQAHGETPCPLPRAQNCLLLPAHVSSALKKKHSWGCPHGKNLQKLWILTSGCHAAHILCPEQICSGAQTPCGNGERCWGCMPAVRRPPRSRKVPSGHERAEHGRVCFRRIPRARRLTHWTCPSSSRNGNRVKRDQKCTDP